MDTHGFLNAYGSLVLSQNFVKKKISRTLIVSQTPKAPCLQSEFSGDTVDKKSGVGIRWAENILHICVRVHLDTEETIITALLFHQVFVISGLHYLSFLKNDNGICITNCGKPVGNHKGCPVPD